MNFGGRDSQQLLLSLASHGIMPFITCKRLAQWHHLNLRTMKLTLQQENRMTSGFHVSLLLIFSLTTSKGSLRTIKDMLIQQILLQQLRRICIHFKIAGYRNKTKMIMITLIKSFVKDSWSLRHDGVQQKVIKRTKEVSEKKQSSVYSWIINKVVSLPKEVSEKKRLSLYSWIINKEISSPTTIKATFYYQPEKNANDSSTNSELFPSQLSALTSTAPADILLDDDSKRSHRIIKKQGRPPKNQRKRNAATAPKFMPAVQQSWRFSLDVH